MDSSWDSVMYRATHLHGLPHQAYVQDMAKLGVVDIAPELLQEMSDRSKHKQQFNMEAMQKVADHMNLKLCEGAQLNCFSPYSQYLHHRWESIALLHHINAGRVGSWQGTGGVSHAGHASARASLGSCHL